MILSAGYHFYTLGAVQRIVETARRLGFDLYTTPKVKEMYTVAMDYQMADGSLPRFGDATTTGISGSRYESAYHYWRDPIFLSVLNVHVNRMPLSGRVVKIERGGADYHAAFRAEAGERNVYCRMHYETPEGLRLSVTQITGWIARRIVCHPSVGEWVARGERFGLIRFGSRTDVTLPLDSRVRVANGDRVRGGVSVLAELPERGAVQ